MYVFGFDEDDDIEFSPEYCAIGCTFDGYMKSYNSENYSEALENYYKFKKELSVRGGSVSLYEYSYTNQEDEESLLKFCIV